MGAVLGAVSLQEFGHHQIDLGVKLGRLIGRPGNDQRRSRLIDQNRVHLIHDGKIERPLDHVLQPVFHVVAQIIKAELVVGAVGDIRGIGGAALVIVQPRHDDPGGQAQEIVKSSHPFRIAPGQVVVHRHHMHALARQRVQIHRQRRHQRLALAGLHLGDFAAMQHHAADHLHVEMPQAQRAFRTLAHDREGLLQNVIQRLASRQPLFKSVCLRPQSFVVQGGQSRLMRGDGRHLALEALQGTVVTGTEYGAGKVCKHHNLSFRGQARRPPRSIIKEVISAIT